MAVATFTLTETIILGMGWIIALFTGVYALFIYIKTPANAFLKAWARGTAVLFGHNRSGEGFFEAATRFEQGFLDSEKSGHVAVVEGSQIYESKSKLPVYTHFTEYASTIPADYPSVKQELQRQGFIINDWDDYKDIFKAAEKQDKNALVDHVDEDIDDPGSVVRRVLDKGVTVAADKTYKLHELADMFPNNLHPSMIEAKIENEVQRRVDDDDTNWAKIGGYASIILAICIGGAVAYEMSTGQASQLTCEVVRTGVRNATNNASANLTV